MTLWVKVPPGLRDEATRLLQQSVQLDSVRANGASLGVHVEHTARADVLVALRQGGIPVVDFWTEASLFGAGGIPALVLGPGDIDQAHARDEWVAIEQLETAYGLYAGLVRADV